VRRRPHHAGFAVTAAGVPMLRYLMLLALAVLLAVGFERRERPTAPTRSAPDGHVIENLSPVIGRAPAHVRIENRGGPGRIRAFGYRMAHAEARSIHFFPAGPATILCVIPDTAVAARGGFDMSLDGCRSTEYDYLIIESGVSDSAGTAWRETACHLPSVGRACLLSSRPYQGSDMIRVVPVAR